MTWTEWIKQYPKLEEYWQMIPEPANILFRQQIDNYANEVAESKVKKISSNSMLADSLPLSGNEIRCEHCGKLKCDDDTTT